MSAYYYIKAVRKDKRVQRLFGLLSLMGGFAIFLYFSAPLLSYKDYIFSVFASETIQNPQGNKIESVEKDNLVDARNWYPEIKKDAIVSEVSYYTLSIPKLLIKDALVSTKNYNLSLHLVQYFGTKTPPQKGTAVIFGHSSLPQLFNARNYKTIFANLHRLKKEDQIQININGKMYSYEVYTTLIVSPEDTSTFEQDSEASELFLVTCTPPGTIWKRLIVKAKLTNT